jgi:DNA (cytosine-5)-methyltransferase 1
MGEQVAAAIGKGWLDRLFADLSAAGYSGDAAVIPACAVNAPHRRDRIFAVAERGIGALDFSDGERLQSFGGIDLPRSEREPSKTATAIACIGSRGVARNADELSASTERQQRSGQLSGASGDSWACDSFILGHDGKARRVEPSIRLLAHGVPARVGKLRAYGNAIVPQVATEVMAAYLECRP